MRLRCALAGFSPTEARESRSMWLLTILTLLNAAANNKTLVLQARFDIFGFPVNIFDLLLGLAVIGLLFQKRSVFFPVDETPRIFTFLCWAFLLTLLAAGFMTFTNDAWMRGKVNQLRNFLSVPLSFLVGYLYLRRPRSATWLSYVYVFAGVASALMVLLYFTGQAETDNDALKNINLLRAVDYVS